MKLKGLGRTIVMTLFTALAIPAGLAGQNDTAQANKPKHHHYKLVDIGLGGPQSAVFEFAHTLTNRGALVGMAEPSIRTAAWNLRAKSEESHFGVQVRLTIRSRPGWEFA